MAHEHSVIDKDKHFVIDPENNMSITCAGTVKGLKRGDHASERYTFEMPRYIEGHDMSLCNKVEAHYNNIKYDSSTRETTTNKSFDDVQDFGISETSEDTVVWTWLVKSDATQLDGTLNFCIRFACMNGDEIEYQKFTDVYASIPVGESIWNTETVAKQNADVLEAWRQELLLAIENVPGQVQADYMQLDNTKPDYIKNAPCRVMKTFPNSSYYHTGRIENPPIGTTRVIDWTNMSQESFDLYINYEAQTSTRSAVLWGSKFYMEVTHSALAPMFQCSDNPLATKATTYWRKLDDKNFYFLCNSNLQWYFITDLSTLSAENAEIYQTKGAYMQIGESSFVSAIKFVELDIYGNVKLKEDFLPNSVVLQEDLASMVKTVNGATPDENGNVQIETITNEELTELLSALEV